MKLKLDENLGKRGKEILESNGHDVVTVADELLQASEDHDLVERCRVEGRCLVTLDLDFANPLIFPPRRHAGVAAFCETIAERASASHPNLGSGTSQGKCGWEALDN